MEICSNNKAKHRSQKLAFGILRLLSLCIVLILFAILGFIIYKGSGAICWEWRYLTNKQKKKKTKKRLCVVCFPGRCDEWHLHE